LKETAQPKAFIAMTLALATLLPGLLLLAVGIPLLMNRPEFGRSLKALPRSPLAAGVFFGGAAAWFLIEVLHLSTADFGDYRDWLFAGFLAVALLSFKYAPEFLAVRGLASLVLLGAGPLLATDYPLRDYAHPQKLLMKALVYVGIALAIWLGAQPFRLRDFLEWLFTKPNRARALGGCLAAYGLVLTVSSALY
jgi:hypothetical protein